MQAFWVALSVAALAATGAPALAGNLSAEQAQALAVALDYLKDHGQEANIPQGQQPSVDSVVAGPQLSWISFLPQKMQGVAVEYTEITVIVRNTAAGPTVHVRGSWAKQLPPLSLPAVDEAAARAAVVGAQCRYGPSIAKTVADADVSKAGELVWTPVPTPANRASYALAWKFMVVFSPGFSGSWMVDAQTGTTLYYGWFRG